MTHIRTCLGCAATILHPDPSQSSISEYWHCERCVMRAVNARRFAKQLQEPQFETDPNAPTYTPTCWPAKDGE
jgi:hypothetical protein